MFVNEKILHCFSTCKWEFECFSWWKRAENPNFVAKTMAISNNSTPTVLPELTKITCFWLFAIDFFSSSSSTLYIYCTKGKPANTYTLSYSYTLNVYVSLILCAAYGCWFFFLLFAHSNVSLFKCKLFRIMVFFVHWIECYRIILHVSNYTNFFFS